MPINFAVSPDFMRAILVQNLRVTAENGRFHSFDPSMGVMIP